MSFFWGDTITYNPDAQTELRDSQGRTALEIATEPWLWRAGLRLILGYSEPEKVGT